MHRGGRGRLSLLCLWWFPAGGALQHLEGGRPIGGMDAQKHSVGCLCGASKFRDGNWFPLGFWLGDGQGRWPWPAPLFPTKLSSVFQGSTPLPPSVLLPHPLRAEPSTLTFHKLNPAGCQNSLSPAPALLQARLWGLCLASGLPLHHSAPSHQSL